MIYELSRDYARAWELIQQGDRLACEYDRRTHRDVGKCDKSVEGTIAISSNQLVYRYLPTVFEFFVERCTKLNIEFYLPLTGNMIVISKERCTEIIGCYHTKKLLDETTNRPN